jgi:hypothetical protein
VAGFYPARTAIASTIGGDRREVRYKSKMTKTIVRWLLFKYVGREFTPLSKPLKTKEQAEKARLKYPRAKGDWDQRDPSKGVICGYFAGNTHTRHAGSFGFKPYAHLDNHGSCCFARCGLDIPKPCPAVSGLSALPVRSSSPWHSQTVQEARAQ